MKNYTSLGELLVDYRTINHISQADLAAQFDVDIRTIIRWEKNETLLKPEKEEAMVEITFIPYQVIRNLNAPVSIPTYFDFNIRKYSLSTMNNDLPDANWIKAKMNEINTSRLRTIQYDSDLEDIIRCSMVQKHISKPIDKKMILRATELLPELNFIFFDTSGYYSGHSVFFPIAEETYLKIRNRKMTEDMLTTDDLINPLTVDNPIYYSYDINTDCNENLYFITGAILHYFNSLENKNYLYAGYTSRHDTFNMNDQLGTKLIWEDIEKQDDIKSIAPPRLYEGNFASFLERI